MFVLGSYDHFSHSVLPISFLRMSEWYKELPDKGDDPHSPFSSRASDAIVGTNRSSYQKQESIENEEEGLAMEKEDYTSSTCTSSSVSTSSRCYDENEHNMWNPLLELFCHVQVGLRMETPVDEVATARVALSCHFALDSLCDKSDSCWFSQKRLLRKLSLSDTFVAAQFVPAQTFSVDELFGTRLALHWSEESHTQTIGLCCQTVQKSSVDRRHADLHRFHFGLFEAPQPPIVAREPLHLMSNDANHGQFRREQHLAGDWQRHLANAFHTWRGVEFFYWWILNINPNLGKTFKVNKQTTLVSQCTCPLLRHTPLFVMDDGEPAADLWFLSVLCLKKWSNKALN